MKDSQVFNRILSSINELKDKTCKSYNTKDKTCKTGCYEEKTLKNTECPYDKDEQKNCECYK